MTHVERMEQLGFCDIFGSFKGIFDIIFHQGWGDVRSVVAFPCF